MTTKINASTSGLTETVDASGIFEFQTANTSAIIIDASQNANFTSTGAITVPVGTTAQRPSSPVNGMIRYNTTTSVLEGYILNNWVTIKSGTYTISVLTVGGGSGASGGTGGVNFGAGGAGGILRYSASVSATPGTVFTAVVGGGGAGVNSGTPGAGNSSTFTGATTATGGNNNNTSSSGTGASNADYSGGGGSGVNAGGGAGAGEAGNHGGTIGTGGYGATNSITGSSTYYGGGGGAGQGGAGGLGGGGTGSDVPTAGGTNTGGGGGGGNAAGGGRAGGSGVVIVSIPTIYYSGITTGTPTVTINGNNTVLTYTSSGTYTA